jgi:nitroreductase
MLRPDPGLYEAVYKRVSRRSYLSMPAPLPVLDELEQLADRFQEAEPEIRIILRREGADRVFQGRAGYGMIVGAVSYMALIAKSTRPDTLLRIGYYGEWLVLTAVKHGLSSCWAAGTFKRAYAESILSLEPGEELVCVSPIGEAAPEKTLKEIAVAVLTASRKRKSLGDMLPDASPDQLPKWQKTALECARMAPSGINLQPWRFSPNGERMRVRIAEGKGSGGTAAIDCGIAMLHFLIGARHEGMPGIWTIAPDPYLAEFVPDRIR